MTQLSVVVPVYRSETTLRELHRRLVSSLTSITSDYEIILVEDCGGDSSWRVLQEIAQADERVRLMRLLRNFGQHNALLCGIRAARYEIIVTLDDDLQNPPEEIRKLVSKLEEGYDVVYGAPLQDQHGFLRNIASRITKLALKNAMGTATARHVSAFRVFRTRLRRAFADFRSPFVSIDVLLTWGTTRFAHVPVQHDSRKSGVSGYTFRKLAGHALNMMTGFSTLPLQLASVVGFAFTLFGMVILAYVVVHYVASGGSVPGFSFLASIIAIFSGAQLFAIGIIGEYLARMHFRTMDRPTYVVDWSESEETPAATIDTGVGREVKEREGTRLM